MADYQSELQQRGVQGVFELIFERLDDHEQAINALAGLLRDLPQPQSQGVIDHGQSDADSDGVCDSPELPR